MKIVLDFLAQYWKEILYLVVSLVLVIISLLRRKNINVINKEDEILAFILSVLPGLICKCERAGHGFEKKKLVSGFCKQLLNKHFGLTEEALQHYDSFISEAIERILATPTKKGE